LFSLLFELDQLVSVIKSSSISSGLEVLESLDEVSDSEDGILTQGPDVSNPFGFGDPVHGE